MGAVSEAVYPLCPSQLPQIYLPHAMRDVSMLIKNEWTRGNYRFLPIFPCPGNYYMGKPRLMRHLRAKLVKKHGHSNCGYLKVYESSFQANLNWHKNFKTQQSCKAYTAIRQKLCAHCLHWP